VTRTISGARTLAVQVGATSSLTRSGTGLRVASLASELGVRAASELPPRVRPLPSWQLDAFCVTQPANANQLETMTNMNLNDEE
jgi:hypothetical protein